MVTFHPSGHQTLHFEFTNFRRKNYMHELLTQVLKQDWHLSPSRHKKSSFWQGQTRQVSSAKHHLLTNSPEASMPIFTSFLTTRKGFPFAFVFTFVLLSCTFFFFPSLSFPGLTFSLFFLQISLHHQFFISFSLTKHLLFMFPMNLCPLLVIVMLKMGFFLYLKVSK